MNQWWYENDGEAAGPVTFDALRKRILSGDINADTLVWTDGMHEWALASSIDELKSLPPPLPKNDTEKKELQVSNHDNSSCEKPSKHYDCNAINRIGPEKKSIINVTKNPWRRFFARTFDFMWCNLVFVILFHYILSLAIDGGVITNQTQVNNILILSILLIQPASILLDADVSSVFVTNLGKMLLGLKVVTTEGAKLEFKDHLKRNLNWMIYGQGVSLPIISTATNIYQFVRLNKNGTTSYDEGSFVVCASDKYEPIPFAALFFAIIYAYSLI